MPQPTQMISLVRDGLLLVVACAAAFALAMPPGPATAQTGEKCEFAGQGGMGPCDPNRPYRWDGECYTDDGCYYQDEPCCEIPE